MSRDLNRFLTVACSCRQTITACDRASLMGIIIIIEEKLKLL